MGGTVFAILHPLKPTTQAMQVVPVSCLLLFNDAHTLGSESEALTARTRNHTQAEANTNGDAIALTPGSAWVPWIMLGADIMAGLASGMTIKFFPVRELLLCGGWGTKNHSKNLFMKRCGFSRKWALTLPAPTQCWP